MLSLLYLNLLLFIYGCLPKTVKLFFQAVKLSSGLSNDLFVVLKHFIGVGHHRLYNSFQRFDGSIESNNLF
jgi:hypothetical protein